MAADEGSALISRLSKATQEDQLLALLKTPVRTSKTSTVVVPNRETIGKCQVNKISFHCYFWQLLCDGLEMRMHKSNCLSSWFILLFINNSWCYWVWKTATIEPRKCWNRNMYVTVLDRFELRLKSFTNSYLFIFQ